MSLYRECEICGIGIMEIDSLTRLCGHCEEAALNALSLRYRLIPRDQAQKWNKPPGARAGADVQRPENRSASDDDWIAV